MDLPYINASISGKCLLVYKYWINFSINTSKFQVCIEKFSYVPTAS